MASVIGEGEVDAVSVTTEEAVALDQSPDDDLNGIVGEMNQPLHETSAGGADNAAFFTNAESASEPAGNVFWNPDGEVFHITWDLGGTEAETRQLDEVSIWIDAHDPGRRGYGGTFYVSMDGTDFTKVPGSFYADRLAQGGTGGDPLYNNVKYTFDEGHVTGFQYLRFVSYGIRLGEPFIAQSRYVEVEDAIDDIDYTVTTGKIPGDWEGGAVRIDEIPNDDGTTTYLYRDSVPVDEAGKRFMLLEMSPAE